MSGMGRRGAVCRADEGGGHGLGRRRLLHVWLLSLGGVGHA